jgi:D-amino peptidase
MKIYISADIEGIAGITHWDEATKSHPDYQEFRAEMTAEVLAACAGAEAAGATEILIKDAHGSGRNIIASDLPDCARLIRGWSGSPLSMVQGLDASFDAVLMIGYHSKAGSDSNPLAHTLTGNTALMTLNGEVASEFLLHAYAAALFEVPVAFVSTDVGLAADITSINPNIHTLAVSEGIGASTVSIAPNFARSQIQTSVQAALSGDLTPCKLVLPKHFELEVHYQTPTAAYRTAHYPGAAHSGPRSIRFETDDYFDVLRCILFTVLSRT